MYLSFAALNAALHICRKHNITGEKQKEEIAEIIDEAIAEGIVQMHRSINAMLHFRAECKAEGSDESEGKNE